MVVQVGVQRDDAVAAGLVGEGDEQADKLVILFLRRGKDVRQAAECGQDGGERKLQEHRAEGAAKDDQGRGGLQDLAQVATFYEQAGHNAENRQKDTANARLIHDSPIHAKLLQSRVRRGRFIVQRPGSGSRGFGAGALLDWPSTSRLAIETARCNSPKGAGGGPRRPASAPGRRAPVPVTSTQVLAHNQLFSVDQREHSVRGGLGGLDQIAIQHNRRAVEPGEFDHLPRNSFAGVIGKRRERLRD